MTKNRLVPINPLTEVPRIDKHSSVPSSTVFISVVHTPQPPEEIDFGDSSMKPNRFQPPFRQMDEQQGVNPFYSKIFVVRSNNRGIMINFG